jgi:ABC-type branched-subunit amino acid transport system ATPase component
MQLSDPVVVLESGKKIFEGHPEEVCRETWVATSVSLW